MYIRTDPSVRFCKNQLFYGSVFVVLIMSGAIGGFIAGKFTSSPNYAMNFGSQDDRLVGMWIADNGTFRVITPFYIAETGPALGTHARNAFYNWNINDNGLLVLSSFEGAPADIERVVVSTDGHNMTTTVTDALDPRLTSARWVRVK